MNPFAISGLLAGISSLIFGLLVLFKSTNKKLGWIWFLFTLSVASWGFGGALFGTAKTMREGMQGYYVAYALGVLWIASLFYHFVCVFLEIRPTRAIVAHYTISFVFLLTLPTTLFFNEGRWVFGSVFFASIGPLFPLFFSWWMALVFYSHYQLIRAYKSVPTQKKNQIKYFFLATALGFTGGCTAYLPLFKIDIYPYGNFAVCLYPLIMAYAIVKHHLMDINVVLRKSLVYSFMVGILTAIYLVFVTQGSHVLQKIFGASPLTISIVTACFITAIFLPLWDRIQTFVDRYFFRDWSERGEMVREVAAGFSHELKSPLAGLSMQAQLALAELKEVEDGRESWLNALPKIRSELEYLVSKSMDAARRIEAVRGVAEPAKGQIEPVDIPAVVDSSLLTLAPLVNEVAAEVRRVLPSDLPPVRSNLKQLEIVFTNLMKNALEAMTVTEERGDGGSAISPARRPADPPNHVLSLSAHEQDGSVVVSIRDTGAGIASKDLHRLFEAYHTTKGRKGTGMGLFLSQQIIKAHGGSIEVQSEEGKGTEFIVRLPKYTEKGSVAA